MPQIDITGFEAQRAKLASGLVACAEQLRNTAQIAEDFANILNGFDVDKGKGRELLEDADGSKKRKRAVKPKDPNAPKRPASSYILFQNDVRTELKKANPNLTNPELLSLISEKWKNMTEDQKDSYNQTMLRMKREYSEAKSAYDARSPAEVEAANKAASLAAAEVAANKKAKTSRTKAAPKAPAPVAAPPPPAPEPESDSDEDDSDDEDDDEDEPVKRAAEKDESSSDAESESSGEESEPAPKRKRAAEPAPAKKSGKKNKA